MKIKDLMEAPISKSLLYHGVKIQHAEEQLKNNEIEGRTNQRIWSDGKRRKEDEEGYRMSWTLSGLSTTRDIEVAKGFGGVVYVLNKDAIQSNYKVMPYDWGFHIASRVDVSRNDSNYERIRKAQHKKEKEEFIITGLTKRSFEQARDNWELLSHVETEEEEDKLKDEMGNDLMSYMFPNKGSLKPLDKYLEAIYITDSTVDIYDSTEHLEFIQNHPKYKGII